MRMWELFPTKGAKIIVIRVVIEDFFLLSSIFKYWTEDQLKDVVFALYGRDSVEITVYTFCKIPPLRYNETVKEVFFIIDDLRNARRCGKTSIIPPKATLIKEVIQHDENA